MYRTNDELFRHSLCTNWQKKRSLKGNQTKQYKTMVRPVLSYGTEVS